MLILPKPNRFKELEVKQAHIPLIMAVRASCGIPDFVRARQINAQLSWCKHEKYTIEQVKVHLTEIFQKEISGQLTDFEKALYQKMREIDAKISP